MDRHETHVPPVEIVDALLGIVWQQVQLLEDKAGQPFNLEEIMILSALARITLGSIKYISPGHRSQDVLQMFRKAMITPQYRQAAIEELTRNDTWRQHALAELKKVG